RLERVAADPDRAVLLGRVVETVGREGGGPVPRRRVERLHERRSGRPGRHRALGALDGWTGLDRGGRQLFAAHERELARDARLRVGLRDGRRGQGEEEREAGSRLHDGLGGAAFRAGPGTFGSARTGILAGRGMALPTTCGPAPRTTV